MKAGVRANGSVVAMGVRPHRMCTLPAGVHRLEAVLQVVTHPSDSRTVVIHPSAVPAGSAVWGRGVGRRFADLADLAVSGVGAGGLLVRGRDLLGF